MCSRPPEQEQMRNVVVSEYEHRVGFPVGQPLGERWVEQPGKAKCAFAWGSVGDKFVIISAGEIDVPSKRLLESFVELRFGARIVEVEYPDLKRAGLREVAKPRRVVLDGMRDDDRQTNGVLARSHG